ncbi:MAG: protein arginine kinase [bacterium]
MKSIESKKLKALAAGRKDTSDAIDDLLWNFGSWLTKEDDHSDVIISSRIRLARNVHGFPFPNRAKDEDLLKVINVAKEASSRSQSLQKALFFNITELPEWDCKYFVERRLASPQFIENEYPNLLIVGPQENLSIMVNEEDHLRIQSIEAGLGMDSAWRKIKLLDDELENYINFSYSAKFGYLTACPTNIGTGLRASFFAHLPALSLSNRINRVINDLPTSEIAVRGFYGEGTESVGNIFQISNQLTLGRTEKSVIERLIKVAQKIVDLEREARETLFKNEKIMVEDTVFRALAILKNARIISSLESLKLLSAVRLGCELELIKNISRIALNQLMVLIQPAHLQMIYKKNLNEMERDITRADFIKQNLEI